MILKLLLFIGLGYFLIKLIYRTKSQIKPPKRTEDFPPATPISNDVQELLACPICQTYFQKEQGHSHNGQSFCSPECASKTS